MALVAYRQLGRSGVRVSEVAVGSVNFGWVTEEDEAHRILDAAFDTGVNLIDTADAYNAGVSEEMIGRWLAKDSGRRDKAIIATKVFHPPLRYASNDLDERPAGTNEMGLSARHITLACEASLRRLGVDHIDLYQMHHVDPFTPVDEIWQAMESLVAQGKIIYVGTSNFSGWQIAELCETAQARDLLGPVAEQGRYHLLHRWPETEKLPACEHFGVGFLAFSTLAGGLLGGLGRTEARRSSGAEDRLPDHVRNQLERFEQLCAEFGHEPAAVAIAWLRSRPAVTSVILGPRTVAHLERAMRSLDVRLDTDMTERIEALFPNPRSEALFKE